MQSTRVWMLLCYARSVLRSGDEGQRYKKGQRTKKRLVELGWSEMGLGVELGWSEMGLGWGGAKGKAREVAAIYRLAVSL